MCSSDLLSQWQEKLSKTGEKFFFNPVTGESTWEDPRLSDSEWKTYYTDDGADVYFYNAKTKQTTWQMPEELADRKSVG